MILTLADELNLTVVAEGIETEDQAKALQAMRCDMAQGFLYSKPVDAAAATKFIVSSETPTLLPLPNPIHERTASTH